MTKSKRAFIRLLPLDHFFFGGARTFGSDNANYYVRSNRFPQQTALVGMLRYQLLLRGKPIGDSSFLADQESRQTFGALQEISPVFLYHQPDTQPSFQSARAYWPHPLDAHDPMYCFVLSAHPNTFVLKQSPSTGRTGSTWQPAAVLSGYDSKRSLIEEAWVNVTGTVVQQREAFLETTRVGITKAQRGDSPADRQQGFYKQQAYKLKPEWSFGFFASFRDDFDSTELDGALVPLGGERSLFRLAVEPQAPEWQDVTEELKKPPFYRLGKTCFVLLSDAMVPVRIYDHCIAAITQTVDFQNLLTPVAPPGQSVHYAALGEKKSGRQLYKSGKFNLLKRGSVLYAQPGAERAIAELLNHANFQNIGYNHYLTT